MGRDCVQQLLRRGKYANVAVVRSSHEPTVEEMSELQRRMILGAYSCCVHDMDATQSSCGKVAARCGGMVASMYSISSVSSCACAF